MAMVESSTATLVATTATGTVGMGTTTTMRTGGGGVSTSGGGWTESQSSSEAGDTYAWLMRLFESEYSSSMTLRHVAAVEKLCRQNENGFLLNDLRHINRLVDILATRAGGGGPAATADASAVDASGVSAREKYTESLQRLVQALGRRPLLRRSVREEDQSLSFLSQLISKLVSIIDDTGGRYHPELQMECVALIRKLAKASVAPLDTTAAKPDTTRGKPTEALILVPVRMVEWGVRALEESNCAMSLTSRLAKTVRASEDGIAEDNGRLRSALLRALVPLSTNPVSATQALSTGLIHTLVELLVDEEDDDIPSAAIEVLWNLLEADRRETVIACNEASEALGAALTTLLCRLTKEGYRERDKGVRNEILIIFKMLVSAGCTTLARAALRPRPADSGAPMSDFFDVLLALGTGVELEPPPFSMATAGSFCFTTDSDDYELKLLVISLLTDFVDCTESAPNSGVLADGRSNNDEPSIGERALEYMHEYGMLKVALAYVAPCERSAASCDGDEHEVEPCVWGRWTSAQFTGIQRSFLTLLNRIVLQLPVPSSVILLNLGAAEALMRFAFLERGPPTSGGGGGGGGGMHHQQHQQQQQLMSSSMMNADTITVGAGKDTENTSVEAKSALQARVMVLLRDCINLPGFRVSLLSMGAIAMALDRGCDSSDEDTNKHSEELRGSAMNFLATLVSGSAAARQQLRYINGIDRITDEVEKLAKSVDPMLPSSHALAVLACCWDGVIKANDENDAMAARPGSRDSENSTANLRVFVEDCDGLAVLLELLSAGNMFMAPVLLSMIADVLHGSAESHKYFHEWRSGDVMQRNQAQASHAAQVVLDIWKRYDPQLNTQTMGSSLGDDAATGMDTAHATPVSRELLAYGSLSQQRRNTSESLLGAMDGTTMLGKCYAVFSALGFESVHEYLPYSERATLAAIEQYVERRHGETWRSIKQSLENDSVVPTEADGERLSKSLRVLGEKTRSLVATQGEFMKTARTMKEGLEQTHYNNIITQQEQATSNTRLGRSGIAGGIGGGGAKINLTMKERLEAKKRRERMLKKSFRPNASEAGGGGTDDTEVLQAE